MVERLLSMQEAQGSIPWSSISFALQVHDVTSCSLSSVR
jgi:hypothetical protein